VAALVGAAVADEALGALRARVKEALWRAARAGRPVVASLTIELDPDLDVGSCVFATRAAEERYFVWEQPDRARFAIGALGAAWTIDAAGSADRFGAASAEAAELLRDASFDDDLRVPGAGPIWVGGFAFAPDGGRTPEWATLPATLLVLPAVSLARHGTLAAATVNVVCRPGDDPEELTLRGAGRLARLRVEPMPLVDPDPVGGYEIASVLAPEQFEGAVAAARDRVRAGDIRKVVLAREVTVEGARPFKPAAVFDALRNGYPSCYCFCVGTPEVAFCGASPELLARREGASVSTVALAGSTRRSADPAVDDHLGERLLHSEKDLTEHRIVIGTIERSLSPHSVWVTAAEEPSLVKVANIQHLGTPIRAQLTEPRSAVELVGVLHPTSAVGGEPWDRAREQIEELEHLDRGWYAGPVGWMDAAEDGEFCVGIRCALVEGRRAHCYVGGGIVGDSDPEAELAETEVKLQVVLPALTGV
jgi:salicylate biosynthesis isochorismate synthase/menaquinone-specific isochorismate synthase